MVLLEDVKVMTVCEIDIYLHFVSPVLSQILLASAKYNECATNDSNLRLLNLRIRSIYQRLGIVPPAHDS